MFSKNNMKIIEFLLRNPNQYNINQIARNVGISIGSAHKILKTLEIKDMINSEKMGNAIFYRLNLENKETQNICEIALIESRNRELGSNPVAKVYAKALEGFDTAKAIVLFGSIMVKKDKANDVDVLFIIKGKNDVKKVNDFCLEISKTKTKPIVPLIMTEKDIENGIKNRDKIVLDILKNGVVLFGEENIIKLIRGA